MRPSLHEQFRLREHVARERFSAPEVLRRVWPGFRLQGAADSWTAVIQQFRVQGSNVYTVTFEARDGTLVAFCTCAAGEQGQHCKHRLAILGGDVSTLIDPDHQAVATVQAWLTGTPLAAALAAVVAAEADVEAAKRGLKAANKGLAAAMGGRVSRSNP